jgi:hypothetical protein
MFVATGDHSGLAKARREAARGAMPLHVFKKFGWFEGPDGHWRREISDRNARIKSSLAKGRETTLGQAISHDELFRAAPELKDTRIMVADNINGEQVAGAYDFDNDLIVVSDASDKDTLFHEIQHAVQTKQQFPKRSRGANPDDVGWDAYINNLGEVEARDAGARRDGNSDAPELLKRASGIRAAR